MPKLLTMNNLTIQPPDLYRFCTINSTQSPWGWVARGFMLSVYARHAADCAKAKDKDWRRCCCPKWISGTHGGELVRKSAKTRSWEKAEAYRRQLEGSGPTPVQTDESFRISDGAPAGRHRAIKKKPR